MTAMIPAWAIELWEIFAKDLKLTKQLSFLSNIPGLVDAHSSE